MRALPLACAAVVWVVSPALAHARPGDDSPLPGDSTYEAQSESQRQYRGHWWGDLGFYSGDPTDSEVAEPDANFTLLTFTAGGSYKVRRVPIAFEVQAGFLAAFLSAEGQDTETTGLLMNPLFAVYYAPRIGRFMLRVGAGIGVPLAGTRSGDDSLDGLVDTTAYVVAAATNGLWDWWKWIPDRLTLLLPTASIEGRIGEHLVLGGELGLHMLFSTASEASRLGETSESDTDAILQLGAEVAYQSRSTRTGVFFRAVNVLTNDDPDSDDTYLSLEPYLRFEVGRGFFRIALTLNLNEPFGFSFASGPTKIWGLHLGGGTQF